jgi:hypothetical protein
MKAKKYHILLVAVLSSFLVVFPAYVHSYSLTQADFLARPHWESPFLEGLLAGLSKKWEILGWNACFLMSDQDNSFFELLRHLSLPKFCPTGQILILRC